jgi:hypothetical protein
VGEVSKGIWSVGVAGKDASSRIVVAFGWRAYGVRTIVSFGGLLNGGDCS